MFTAADISLTVLLNRFTLLGMDSLYFPSNKCPYTHSYYNFIVIYAHFNSLNCDKYKNYGKNEEYRRFFKRRIDIIYPTNIAKEKYPSLILFCPILWGCIMFYHGQF
jgi:hypothetical protein